MVVHAPTALRVRLLGTSSCSEYLNLPLNRTTLLTLVSRHEAVADTGLGHQVLWPWGIGLEATLGSDDVASTATILAAFPAFQERNPCDK